MTGGNRIALSAALFVIGATFTLGTLMVAAAVPQLINFQGILKDGSGNTVPDGSYSVAVRIYDVASGGSPALWSDTFSVTTAGGTFNIVLGSEQSLPSSLFSSSDRWVGVQVGGDAELTPRTHLTSVPYSAQVGTVDGATGGIISGDVSIQSGLPLPGNNNALDKAGAGTADILLSVADNNPTLEFTSADPMTSSFKLEFDSFEDGVTSKTSVANGALSSPAYRWATQIPPQPETEVMRITYGGDVSVNGGIGARTIALGIISPGPPQVTPFLVRGAAGQVADLMELQDNSGTPLMSVGPDGDVGIGTAFASSRLCVGGAIATAVTVVSSPNSSITLDASHSIVLCNAVLGEITINLPTAGGIAGRQYTIKLLFSNSGFVTIDPFGNQSIEGAATYSLNSQYKYATIVSDGANWWVVANN